MTIDARDMKRAHGAYKVLQQSGKERRSPGARVMTTVGSAIMCMDSDGAPWSRLRNKPVVQENICPLCVSALVSQCQSNVHHFENRFRNDLFSPREAREKH